MVTAPTRPMISVVDISVAYDDAVVLQGVSMEVATGEWLGVIGPNGAGKTTLLRAIAGTVPAQGGVTVMGKQPGARNRRRMARLAAHVPQDPLLPPGMSVFEYVMLGRTAHLSYFGVEGRTDHDVVWAALTDLDLVDFARREVTTLSGGEQQRTVLARALAQDAPVLLLDEPTSALDVGHQQQVLELVEQLRRERGLAVVSAMHDLTLAGQFADRLLLLARGRLVACGPAGEVLTERALSEHWGARVRVLHDPDGGVVVIPVRASARKEVRCAGPAAG